MMKQAKIDWAEIVDLLASEYGWTIEYIKSLDLGQIITLLRAIKNRYSKRQEIDGNSDDNNEEGSIIRDFKTMGGVERIRGDGRKEIVL